MAEESTSRLTTLLALLACLCAFGSCESGYNRTIKLARANISSLNDAVVYSDRSALAALLSDSALGRYESSGKVDWEGLLEDVVCSDQALSNVIRTSVDEESVAFIGWGGKYHVLVRVPLFLRRADGRLVFDGLSGERILATDRTAAVGYLDNMNESDFRGAFFSSAGFHLSERSGLMRQPDPREMEILPRGVEPEWLFNEDMAFLNSAADALDGIDQQLTAAASRSKLEAMAQGGEELVLLGRAVAHDRSAYERLALLYNRQGAGMERAWERVKRNFYQIEQDDPRFVMDLGNTMDRFMSIAGALQACPPATSRNSAESR